MTIEHEEEPRTIEDMRHQPQLGDIVATDTWYNSVTDVYYDWLFFNGVDWINPHHIECNNIAPGSDHYEYIPIAWENTHLHKEAMIPQQYIAFNKNTLLALYDKYYRT